MGPGKVQGGMVQGQGVGRREGGSRENGSTVGQGRVGLLSVDPRQTFGGSRAHPGWIQNGSRRSDLADAWYSGAASLDIFQTWLQWELTTQMRDHTQRLSPTFSWGNS